MTVKVVEHVIRPALPSPTYDITGLTEAQFLHIRKAVGASPDEGTGITIYRAMTLGILTETSDAPRD